MMNFLETENKFIMELRIKPRQGLLKMIYFSIPMGKSVQETYALRFEKYGINPPSA